MPKSLEKARQRVDNATDRAQRQAKGTARNTRELASSFRFDRILPNGLVGLVNEVLRTGAYALGRGTAEEQVWASIKWIILAIVVSPFTLGWSLVIAIPAVFGLLIGILRLVPVANRKYRGSTSSALRDRNIPWWRD